jgi:glycosyltransferase involved in cell wall biosynthesis
MKIVMVDGLVGNDYSIWLCRGLAHEGHNVTLICPENRQAKEEAFTIMPVSPAKGRGNRVLKSFRYLYYLIWLWFYLRLSGADIVHFQFFRRERSECLFFPFLHLLNKPIYFTAHNVLPHEATKIDRFLRALVYKTASKILVHSPSVKKRLLKQFPMPSEKVQVIPAVRPVSGLRDSEITRQIAREHLGIAPELKVLLFFGFIREYKGLDLLLKAFDIAKENHSDLMLIVAGKAQTEELQARYEEEIKGMKFSHSVILRPEFIPKEEVDYYFRAADALAVPYSKIDFSGVLQEAFSYSLPVLATNVGNFRELIQQGINGYVTNENTPEEFAQIMKLAFQNMDTLALMGKAAYALDQSHPSWEIIGKLTAALYEQDFEKTSQSPELQQNQNPKT